MEARTTLDEILSASIATYSVHAAQPDASPDLWGVEGDEAKRVYYTKYVEGINFALNILRPTIDSKDGKAYAYAKMVIESEREMALEIASEQMRKSSVGITAYAEGLGHSLDHMQRYPNP